MTDVIKAVAETLYEIKKDMNCGCGYHCSCGSNPIEEEVMETVERYFSILLEKLGGDPDKVTNKYDWKYEEVPT